MFIMNTDATGTPSQDSGFIIERGDLTNVAFFWDETDAQFELAYTNQTGGDDTLTTASPHRAGLQLASLNLIDNEAIALDIKEPSGTAPNSYMKFVTSNGTEKIVLGVELQGSDFNIDGGDIASGVTINKSPSIELTGDVTGTGTLTNLANVSFAATLAKTIVLTTDTSGSYVEHITGGTGIDSSVASAAEGTTPSLSVNLYEVAEVAIANGDSIVFMDNSDGDATKRENKCACSRNFRHIYLSNI